MLQAEGTSSKALRREGTWPVGGQCCTARKNKEEHRDKESVPLLQATGNGN